MKEIVAIVGCALVAFIAYKSLKNKYESSRPNPAPKPSGITGSNHSVINPGIAPSLIPVNSGRNRH